MSQAQAQITDYAADDKVSADEMALLVQTIDRAAKIDQPYAMEQATKSVDAMASLHSGTRDLQARLFAVIRFDLKLAHVKDNVWMPKAELKTRPKCTKAGEATTEIHEYYDCPTLLCMREMIVARGDEKDDRYIKGWDKRQYLTTFNTALREVSKKKGFTKIQLQGNEAGGYYIRAIPETTKVPVEDLEKADAKKVMKEKLDKALNDKDLVANVTFNEALTALLKAYDATTKTGSMVNTLIKHATRIKKDADDAKAKAAAAK